MWRIVAGAMLAALVAGCSGGNVSASATTSVDGSGGGGKGNAALVTVTVQSRNGAHVFQVEAARTAAAQERGLMFRTDIPKDGGMLFAPYPPDGPPRAANFWMKDTPSSLDILFIRPDHTIARIEENTVPFSQTLISSGEAVAAVLEINGGRAGELGINEGDKVSWDR